MERALEARDAVRISGLLRWLRDRSRTRLAREPLARTACRNGDLRLRAYTDARRQRKARAGIRTTVPGRARGIHGLRGRRLRRLRGGGADPARHRDEARVRGRSGIRCGGRVSGLMGRALAGARAYTGAPGAHSAHRKLILASRLLRESACASASSSVTRPSLYSLCRAASKLQTLLSPLRTIDSLIPVTSPRRTSSEICGVLSMTSTAARRLLSAALTSRFARMAGRHSDRASVTCFW